MNYTWALHHTVLDVLRRGRHISGPKTMHINCKVKVPMSHTRPWLTVCALDVALGASGPQITGGNQQGHQFEESQWLLEDLRKMSGVSNTFCKNDSHD